METVRTSNQQAGAIAMYVTTRLSPQKWGEAVAEFNEWLAGNNHAHAPPKKASPGQPGAEGAVAKRSRIANR